ncbi:helix-turn-helix domain-containing protein [Cytobacillus oceanisediminis]|uniref:helix-turn-helix domain-containing protein n=1 Tax=Cytobacillus oceanisediminis TaxID=665099 RepID=UPI0020421186|nr:helix-turn-helix domain-containing protein [Cytobacillus oceanisediminis]
MDRRTEVIERLIDETGLSKKAFAEKIGLPPTTLRSMLQRGIGNATVDNVIKVCKGLGITTDDLEKMAKNQTDSNILKEEPAEYLPTLNAKDEKDIQIELQKMIDGLSSNSGYAAFDGENLDDMDEEDKELLIASLENSLRLAKRLAKQKFTPNKYRNK